MPIDDTDDEMPKMICPRCKAVLIDFDGFGVLAHTKPAYPDGCGYCWVTTRVTHPEPLVWRPARRGTRAAVVAVLVALGVVVLAASAVLR